MFKGRIRTYIAHLVHSMPASTYGACSSPLQSDPHISMGDVARISPASPGKTSNLQSSVVAAEVPLSGGVSHAFTFERRS